MTRKISLSQKKLIVKWYYKFKESISDVQRRFKKSFHFNPVLDELDQVLESFETSGSLCGKISCGLTEESENTTKRLKFLTLRQKVFIVKCYYKNDEKFVKVRALFEDKFRFYAFPKAIEEVIETFELSGSVVEHIVCGISCIKEKPVVYIEIEDEEEEIKTKIIKEEPCGEATYTTINSSGPPFVILKVIKFES